jgi:hypothetical protein
MFPWVVRWSQKARRLGAKEPQIMPHATMVAGAKFQPLAARLPTSQQQRVQAGI